LRAPIGDTHVLSPPAGESQREGDLEPPIRDQTLTLSLFFGRGAVLRERERIGHRLSLNTYLV